MIFPLTDPLGSPRKIKRTSGHFANLVSTVADCLLVLQAQWVLQQSPEMAFLLSGV